MNPTGLTKKYICLQRIHKATMDIMDDEDVDCVSKLDDLYRQIVESEIQGVEDLIEKLQFSVHCLTVEEDYAEAGQILEQVCAALQRPQIRRLVDSVITGPAVSPRSFTIPGLSDRPEYFMPSPGQAVAQNQETRRQGR